MAWDQVELIGRTLFVLAVPFMLGIIAGVELVKRRKEVLLSAEAGLGRTFNELIDQTASPLQFTGKGVTVTREVTITRNGTRCKVTFEAENS